MSGIIGEFITRLAYQVDLESHRKAEAAAGSVAATVEAAERRTTGASVQGTSRRIIEANRERGVRTRGAASYIADLKRQQGAEEAVTKASARSREDDQRARERDQRKADLAMQVRIAAISAGFGAMAKLVASAADAVVERVQVIAQQFDRMYYMSSRVNASATNVRALSYALRQNGVDANSANSSIENFGRALRTNPGRYQWLERLGIQTKDANGKLRDTTDLMQDLGRILAKKPEALQYQFFEEFGLDDNTGRALVAGVSKYTDEYKKKLKDAGLDPDKAAKDGHKLSQTMTSLGESLSIIGDKIASKLFEKRDSPLQNFIGFLDRNGDRIAAVVDKIASVLMELGQALLKILTSPEAEAWFNTLLKGFGQVDEKTGEFTADLDKIKVALGLVAAYFAGSWLKKVLEVFGILGLKWGALLRALGIGGAAVTTAAIGSAIGADVSVPNASKPGVSNHWDDEASGAAGGAGIGGALKRGWNAVKRGAGRLFGGGGAAAAEAPSSRGGGAAGAGVSRKPSQPQNEREQRAMARLIERGWTPEAAASAIGQAVEESSVRSDGPLGDTARFGFGDAAAHGMFQWREDRFRALKRFAEARNKPWTDFDTQVDFFDEERKQRSRAERNWHQETDLGRGNAIGKVFENYKGPLQPQREAHARRLLKEYRNRQARPPSGAGAAPSTPAAPAPEWKGMPAPVQPPADRRAELRKSAAEIAARLPGAAVGSSLAQASVAASENARGAANNWASSSVANTVNNHINFTGNYTAKSTDPVVAAKEVRSQLETAIQEAYRNTRSTTV